MSLRDLTAKMLRDIVNHSKTTDEWIDEILQKCYDAAQEKKSKIEIDIPELGTNYQYQQIIKNNLSQRGFNCEWVPNYEYWDQHYEDSRVYWDPCTACFEFPEEIIKISW